MFDPCSEGKCQGRDRSGWGNDNCRECRLTKAENEVSHLEFRLQNELEPRIKAEHNAYDRWATDPER